MILKDLVWRNNVDFGVEDDFLGKKLMLEYNGVLWVLECVRVTEDSFVLSVKHQE